MEPAIRPEELHAQRDFLRRLARGLLGDELLAEDVVQEVELRALERPPRTRENLGGWLAAVTRNLALNALRARERREQHERRSARDELVASHVEALEGIDFQRRVLDAVQALREPYRTVVWQRYYEERTPAEIARRLDVPVATVKTRLQRALVELRAELDRACGERGAWMALLMPLASGGGWRPAWPAGIGALSGAFTMKKVALGSLLVALVWSAWRSSSSPADSAAVPEASARPELALEEPVPADSTAPDAFRVPLAPAPDEREAASTGGPASLALHVVWESDGSAAAGVGLTLWPEDEPRPEFLAHTLVTDAEGRASLGEIAPGRYTLHTDRDGREALALEAGERRALELVVPSGVDVAGLVIDEQGRAVPAAEIWLEASDTGLLSGRVAALSDADGSFYLRSVGREQALAAYRPERGPSALERLRDKQPMEGESALRVTLELGAERAQLCGLVLDDHGRPLPSALVALGEWGNSSVQARDGRWRGQVKARVARCDDAGGFCSSWAGTALAPVHVLAPGHALGAALGQGNGMRLEIRLVRGATIEGRVRSQGGAPVAGAEVRLVSAGAVSSECPFPLPRCTSAEDGSYRLEHVPPGRVELSVHARGARRLSCRDVRELADGARERWDLELVAGFSISGRALDSARNAIAKASIVVIREQGSSLLMADEDGRFALSMPDEDERLTLELIVSGSLRARRADVRAGDEVELVADAASGALRGRFVDAAARMRAGEGVSVHLRCSEWRLVSPTAEMSADGTFAFPELAPGRYRVVFQSEGAAIARSEWVDVRDGDALDLGTIESRAPGAVEVVFQTPDGERCFPSGWLRELDGDGRRRLERDGDVWRASGLEPGRYRLSASGLHLALHGEELEVHSGAVERLAVVVRPAVYRVVTLTVPAGASFESLAIEVRDTATGETVARGSELVERLWLPIGSFELTAVTDTGLGTRATLEVADLLAEVSALTFELR